MADGYVQVAADGAGKKVATAELTRDDSVVIERQEVVLSDGTDVGATAQTSGERGRGQLSSHDRETVDLLASIDQRMERLELLFLRMLMG